MPAHIGFLGRIKIGLSQVAANIGQGQSQKNARNGIAQQKSLERVNAAHPELGEVERIRLAQAQVRRGDGQFSLKDMKKAYTASLGNRRHTLLASYVAYRRYINACGPNGVPPTRGSIPEQEWVTCLAEGTAFDGAVQAAFRDGYTILLVSRGESGAKRHQIKRIEAFKGDVWKPEHSVILWSLAEGWA